MGKKKCKVADLVIFEGYNEILVTSSKHEKKFVKNWITGIGKNLDNYDRIEVDLSDLYEYGFRIEPRIGLDF